MSSWLSYLLGLPQLGAEALPRREERGKPSPRTAVSFSTWWTTAGSSPWFAQTPGAPTATHPPSLGAPLRPPRFSLRPVRPPRPLLSRLYSKRRSGLDSLRDPSRAQRQLGSKNKKTQRKIRSREKCRLRRWAEWVEGRLRIGAAASWGSKQAPGSGLSDSPLQPERRRGASIHTRGAQHLH